MNPARKLKLNRQISNYGIPLAYVVVTLAAGMTFVRLEHHYFPNLVSALSAESAIAICSSIASGMIALTAIVFSMTFVMVQFSATAYSPRLVLWVARDPVVAHALGMFSATFLYSLLLLAWIDREAGGKVPLMSGWTTVGLLLASMIMFVALIDRVGSLQVHRMLIFTGDRGRDSIGQLYEPLAAGAVPAQAASLEGLKLTQSASITGRPEVVQAIHIAGLVELARQHDAIIEVLVAVGGTVFETSPLLRVYGARQAIDEAALLGGLELGDERTFEQDPKYAIRLVVDIAIKALSPAINDPTTAVQALDQIEDLLIRLGNRNLEIGDFRDGQGALRLVVPFPKWEAFLLLALDEIRSCGASSVQVMRRMNALVKNLREVLPAERNAALRYWEHRLKETIEMSFEHKEEKDHASVSDRQGLGIGDESRVKE
jgi:uncharacterized membrane protein